jgi:hypothetical protein
VTTTTKLQDYLGRWLSNATPGTTNAGDFLGRNVITGDKDFLGRNLTLSNPAVWVTATAYTVGTYCRSVTGANIMLATVAGTSGAAEPAWPATVGGGVDDGASTPKLHWVRVR